MQVAKMRLIPVTYFGFTAMDRRFSSPMLPWIVSEIRKREHYEKLSVGVEDGQLQVYNGDFEVQFSHRIADMFRFSQADLDPCTFLYLLRGDDTDNLLYCYLYQAYQSTDVTDLYQQMKDQTNAIAMNQQQQPFQPPLQRSISSAAMLTSLCADISPYASNFFEVLYIGKIKVWHRTVTESFIDDALVRFQNQDVEDNKVGRRKLGRLRSEMNLRRSIDLSAIGQQEPSESLPRPPSPIKNGTSAESNSITMSPRRLIRSHSLISNLSIKSPDIDRQVPQGIERIPEVAPESGDCDIGAGTPSHDASASDHLQQQVVPSVASDEHNRTMVLQIDGTDLRLISPDRKVILLNKRHRDVVNCLQGVNNTDHFGFICRELPNVSGANPATVTGTGYVFRCANASVAGETVSAIRQAYSNACSVSENGANASNVIGGKVGTPGNRPTITSCEHCPMVWYHRLCCDVENLSDRKTQAAIFRRIDQLDQEEQNIIVTKFRGAETDSLREQNEFLMMLLRAHCEMKQGRHVHDSGDPSRSEFLNQLNLGNNTIFMKAKRSLSNSFDHLLKRKASKDDFNPILKDLTLPLNREHSPNLNTRGDSDSDSIRSRSSTLSSQDNTTKPQQHNGSAFPSSSDNDSTGSIGNNHVPAKSPMIDIFFKVGNSSARVPSSGDDNDDSGSVGNGAGATADDVASLSWRQSMFKRVRVPSDLNDPDSASNSSSRLTRTNSTQRMRSPDELKQLWRKAIKQAVLLVRMEKENARLTAQQESSAVKRIKLEYDELRVYDDCDASMWDTIVTTGDRSLLRSALRDGVPRGKRGEVWQMIAQNWFDSNRVVIDTVKFPNYHVPYQTLLKQLTSHQHAILIDLGRTFPNHSYFSSPMGPGQLGLFNLLKAYSLLDPQVGYCQGLSFVAGILLLHLEEQHAYGLLRHLMIDRQLRRMYLPDMAGLPVRLYQLSRLVHDQLPAVHQHLCAFEVDPTLYAAPWMLTMFASQYPLGFVARVFDLLFLESTELLFKVAITLLTVNKDKLCACDGFEEIMDCIKCKFAAIDRPLLEVIMQQVNGMEITRPLADYEVEYTVLQEEMPAVQLQLDELQRLRKITRTLTAQNKTLNAQLDQALTNVQRLEMTRTVHQNSLNRLEMQNRNLEVSLATVAHYLSSVEDRLDGAEDAMPTEVRRILNQIQYTERRRSGSGVGALVAPAGAIPANGNSRASPHRLMVKSLSTGRIAIPERNTLVSSPSYQYQYHHHTTPTLQEEDKSASNSPTHTAVTNTSSSFFSQTHRNILQMTGRRNSCAIVSSTPEPPDVSPTGSVDSGVGAPITPNAADDVDDGTTHPLCDTSGGEDCTFNGTRELPKSRLPHMMGRRMSADQHTIGRH